VTPKLRSGHSDFNPTADRRDNRSRILDAADHVFGAAGAAGSTEDVAALAGVGIATVFRHFPTKQDLLRTVLVDRLEGLRDRGRELAASADPGAAFFDFFTEVVDGATTKLTIADALRAQGPEEPGDELRAAGQSLQQAFAELVDRAQAAGAVRTDAAAPELFALMIGASRTVAYAHLPKPLEDRLLTLLFDAMRARPT